MRSSQMPSKVHLMWPALAVTCASNPPPSAQPLPPACPEGYQRDGYQCQPGQAPPATSGAAAADPAGPTTTGTSLDGTLHETRPGLEAVRLDASAAKGAVEMLTPAVTAAVPDGAKPVGPLIAGQFSAGQSLTETVSMRPGACYTAVGLGAPPVSELDIAFSPTIALPDFDPTAARDPETGSVATIGKRPNCFKWRLPTTGAMRLTVTVVAGEGVAAAQVYEKL